MGGGTHVEDQKGPVEVKLPNGDHFLVTLRMKELTDCIPPVLFGDLPMDLCHSSAIKSVVSEVIRTVRHRFNLHGQIVDRFAHGLTEVVQFLSLHPTVKGFTHIDAG